MNDINKINLYQATKIQEIVKNIGKYLYALLGQVKQQIFINLLRLILNTTVLSAWLIFDLILFRLSMIIPL